ncbi:MAG: TauD/TfdA family dioxygenase [Acidobacteria bacterium]|nr:TauD/TfdA family dioxygenase [Acidobacteriota bacterium]
MTAWSEKLAGLSPAQRELLELRLRKQRVAQLGADGIAHQPGRSEAPLSFAQQRLWFLHQLQPDSPAYNIHNTVRLRGALNVEALEHSFNEIARRHDALRTTFRQAADVPRQFIVPQVNWRLTVEGFRPSSESEPAGEPSDAVRRLLAAEAQRPFDLERGPLWRVRLLRLKPDDHVLMLVMHHIISDGWSLGVLLRELTTCYEAFATGCRPELPPLPVQYADYAVWQRDCLSAAQLDAQLAYWRRQLAGSPPRLVFKQTTPKPPEVSGGGARHGFSISAALTQSLKQLSRNHDATLFMTLLTAFNVLLWRTTGEPDLWIGTDVANRPRPELEPLIGFFVNLLVLRTRLKGEASFSELLRGVRQTTLAAYEHQQAPFEKIVQELQPERGLDGTPLVQTLFVLQNAPLAPLRLAGLDWRSLEVDEGATTFDLLLIAAEADGQLHFTCKYKTALFDASAIVTLMQRFSDLLTEIAAHPESAIRTLTHLPGAIPMSNNARKQSALSQLMAAKPNPVKLSPETLVETDTLRAGEHLPLVLRPKTEALALAEWARGCRAWLTQLLTRHGAILFRGFGLRSAEELEQVALAFCPALFGDYGDLPREAVSGRIYHSTPYPPDLPILLHNESSQMHTWPMKMWFLCLQPAQQGGETPLADGRRIYQRLAASVRERFREQGLLYVRNYIAGIDVSWQEFFRTTDQTAVAEQCRRAGMEYEWKPDGVLTTRKRCPAVLAHPQTGELVFFNQLQAHHVSCLEAKTRETLLSLFALADLPRNVYYGDGTPIEDELVREIRGIYEETAVKFPWQKGDVVMLDNLLTAHGRSPFVGPRKILVAMGEMISDASLAR